MEVIEMRSDTLGARVWFDPIGLFVEPGTRVRWIVRENVHTTTAYHPKNDKHSLRMPAGARHGCALELPAELTERLRAVALLAADRDYLQMTL